MASSSSSSCKIIYLLFYFLLLLSSCMAARPGVTLMVDKRVFMPSENKKSNRKLYETSFFYGNRMFNYLPKGVPIPPSGPSKRHNSLQN
ncbi:hypothetical protein JCGZ_18266 [Jatropha curcas]|uniref:Uncharacterized protein n=1 Tax=Jatropha curcas TaxID=180498 RepID=A0A067KAR0_JATCU|nr:hypothetical protein JCGZ_18266 [Jatropha curcas]